MKNKIFLSLFCLAIMTAAMGCSRDESSQKADEVPQETNEKMDQQSQQQEKGNDSADPNVDLDLTVLSSTMLYSEVYNIVMVPDDYIGKTIKMKGLFRTYPSQEKDTTYFAVVIPDATACCEQGFEFIWDGEHTYPEDYPSADSEIEITGRLDTYEENGLEYFYVVADNLVILN
ncbi:hypothetical protein [Anaerotignum sp.]|uniref:hypothetical protein n=1 Tax=Anaerotignum sp. TaxID=2039241 RepID=UPI0028AAE071|nr:hypothetical protein [Anaerotignum sp.]